ncbi:hypothetical protein D0T49_08625 [Paludibacter sp. 221]|uniref:DUF5723 family protein n=1 Tax=Paludibacter sp. 221 TaxID=2302939 RepID=UPI0013D8CBCD|nr:DUF5723 family protein [Paludibacter sp. 221]NDV47108.1 hypothetical protein [Paludibacter sp. 221]
MKKAILSALTIIISFGSVYSQKSLHSTYFLNEWSKRHTHNAAFAPEYGYFSLPVIGGVEVMAASNSGLSTYLYPYGSEYVTFMHESVSSADFLKKLDSSVYVNQGLSLDILSFGFFIKRTNFISFDVKLKERLNVQVPKDLFALMKNGMSNSYNSFNIKNLGIEQTNYLQFAAGYSRDINEQIRVGGSVKYLYGIASERINYNRFDVTLNHDRFEVETEGEATVMSNMVKFSTDEEGYFNLNDINFGFDSFAPAGNGFAVDLGVTYKPIKNLTLALAFNDLGFMSWKAASIQKGHAVGNVNFTGFNEIEFAEIGSSIEQQIEQLTDDAMELIKFKEDSDAKNIMERTPFTFNLSAEYSIFNRDDHDILVGLLWQTYSTPVTRNTNELVLALTAKALPWLTFSGTCEFLHKDYNRFGLAMNLSPLGFNFFIASDFLSQKFNPQFIPINKFYVNVAFGLSFSLDNF